MDTDQTNLLFVYNANSGLGSAILDVAHKVLDPATYSCSLCQLTYGTLREKENWKRFRAASRIPMTFLHKDEFADEWGREELKKHSFPAIFLHKGKTIDLLVSTEEINAMTSEKELIHRMTGIIESLGRFY